MRASKTAKPNDEVFKVSKMSGQNIAQMTTRLRIVAVMTTLLLVTLSATSGFAQDGDEKKDVITPENADPTEKYNLPPNFDPNSRPKRTPRNVKVTIDFRQAQLEEVVKFFSGVMNKNFIISDSINTSKTITIISPKEVTLSQAYRAFLSALQMNGLTIVESGAFSKIVASKEAKTEPAPTYGADERIPNEARMVTAIVPVESGNLEEIEPVIKQFATPDATIQTFGTSFIITENGANLRRLRSLIERLDKGDAASKVYVYRVLHADATEVAGKLEEIFEAQKGGGAATSSRNRRSRNTKKTSNASDETGSSTLDVDISDIIPDERTNQLIIVSNKKSFEKIRAMIDILDVPTAVGGQIHVKSLEYADAEELSSTLSSLASGVQQNNRGSSARTTARARAASSSAQGGGQQVADLLSGEVQITSYKPTNSLVVVASPRDFVALESVIDQLDRPRRQVYVEAIIMEIGLDTNSKLGLGFNVGAGQDFDGLIPDSAVEEGLVTDTRGLLVGQSNFQGIEAALGGSGGAIGLLGPAVTLPGTSLSLPAFALLLQATQTDNSVNILSTPAILTMDNEEAEIVVGERVPFLRGLAGGGGGGLSSLIGSAAAAGGADSSLGNLGAIAGGLGGLGGLVSPIDYEDVGITLRILPQVNESDYVRLEVDQEVSDIKGAGGLGAGAPIRTRRNAKTVVLVKDQSTIVIGGLIRDVENDTVEKVPFLGDIPLLGVLFRNTSSITTKQNLVLMLTPYIIESEADLQKIQKRKMEERKELLRTFGRRDLQYIKNVNFQKKSGLMNRMREQITSEIEDKAARDAALEAFDQDGPQYRILGSEVEANQAETQSESSDGAPNPDAPSPQE